MRKIATDEKKRRGTLKFSREKAELSYEPLTSVPAPAFRLNEVGLVYFEQFCGILISNKTLTIADVPGITRAARWFEIYSKANEKVGEDASGAVQTTATGYTQQTGYFTVMEKSEDRLIKFEALYGMNMTARTKINLPKPEKKNAFDEI